MSAKTSDHLNLYGSFTVPTGALEIRTSVGTGSIAFSSSLDSNKGYFLACYGANGAFTVGASGLTLTDGLGASQGLPLTDGVPAPFVPASDSSTLRFRTLSGTATHVFLWEAVK